MALPALGTTEWNEIASAYLYNYLARDPRDQYYKKHPTLVHLRARQKTKHGGLKWAWPILDGSDAVGRSYTGTQGHTMQDVKVATMAEESCFFWAEPIFIAHTDAEQATGPDQLFSLLDTKVRHAKLRLAKKHSSLIFASTKAATTDPTTLRLAIPIDPTASVAFHNLNGSAGNQTYWRNKTQTCTGSWSGDGINKLDDLLNDIAEEAGDPSLLVTTKAVFRYMQTNARGYFSAKADVYTSAAKQMIDLGIPVMYHNNIPIIHDPDCTSGVVYALNDDAICWTSNEGGDYTMMQPGFVPAFIGGVMGQAAYMRLEGQLIVEERRALGQVDTITSE